VGPVGGISAVKNWSVNTLSSVVWVCVSLWSPASVWQNSWVNTLSSIVCECMSVWSTASVWTAALEKEAEPAEVEGEPEAVLSFPGERASARAKW
jgi:hypothetical protein